MGYLVCKKCKGFYELQPGESPDDYVRCHCGGVIQYYETLEEYEEYKKDSKENSLVFHCPDPNCFYLTKMESGDKCPRCGKTAQGMPLEAAVRLCNEKLSKNRTKKTPTSNMPKTSHKQTKPPGETKNRPGKLFTPILIILISIIFITSGLPLSTIIGIIGILLAILNYFNNSIFIRMMMAFWLIFFGLFLILGIMITGNILYNILGFFALILGLYHGYHGIKDSESQTTMKRPVETKSNSSFSNWFFALGSIICIVFVWFVIAPMMVGTSQDSGTVIIQVSSTGTYTDGAKIEGSWSGSYGDESGSQSVDGSGDKSFQITGNPRTVSATFQSKEKSSSLLPLTVQIIKDGVVLESRTSSANYGVVSVSHSF